MSLFDAPEGSILVHACNSQGVWGSGIAKEFKKRFPEDFEYYKFLVESYNSMLGTMCSESAYSTSHKYAVGWIVTSHDYGPKKDPPEVIKIHTAIALDQFCERLLHPKSPGKIVYSNKFNSGLFAVPWEETELILKTVLKRYPEIKWIVCVPDTEE